MKRSQDYVRYVAPVAQVALIRGGFEPAEHGNWRHGRRIYGRAIVTKLISDGLARRLGNRVVKQ